MDIVQSSSYISIQWRQLSTFIFYFYQAFKQQGYIYNIETKRSCYLTSSLCLLVIWKSVFKIKEMAKRLDNIFLFKVFLNSKGNAGHFSYYRQYNKQVYVQQDFMGEGGESFYRVGLKTYWWTIKLTVWEFFFACFLESSFLNLET